MKNPGYFLLILFALASCKTRTGEPLSKQPLAADSPKPLPKELVANDTTTSTADNNEPLQPKVKTHLLDTTYVEGSFILFLRPNDVRYAELESISEDIGEGDSDFGVGNSNTLDSLKHNPHYGNIKALVSSNRYINIKDCIGGPLVIDRDSVNYGYIMSGKGKRIESSFNNVHSGHYCGEIDTYFFGRGIDSTIMHHSVSCRIIPSVTNTPTVNRQTMFRSSDSSQNPPLRDVKYFDRTNINGKVLFAAECEACHPVTGIVDGPKIQHLLATRNAEWLFKFFTDRDFRAKDKFHQNMKSAYNHIDCVEKDSMTREEAVALFYYIRSQP